MKNEMLTIKPPGQLVHKVVKTRTGEFVLATFLVCESNDELQVQLLGVKPVAHSAVKAVRTVALPAVLEKSPAVTLYRHHYHSITSPFFNIFEFFVSQPTRAPSRSV